MKTPILLTALALLTFSLPTVQAQGPLANPGPPGPTQKSLQQIWDKIGSLETQVGQLRAQNQALSAMLARSDSINLAWNLRTVDTSSGEFLSLAFGADGFPAIAYSGSDRFSDPQSVKFARFNGTSWNISVVESIDEGILGECGRGVSLSFDPSGNPAVCYRKTTTVFDGAIGRTTQELRFAHYNGSTWTLTTLVTGSATLLTGGPEALKFGPDSEPAITYLSGDGARIHYIKRTGGAWNISVVDAVSDSSPYIRSASLVFGPQGVPSIAYSGAEGVKFAKLNGPVWEVRSVDPHGFGPSLAYGPDQLPSVAYIKNSAPGSDMRGLALARRFRGNLSWETTLIDGSSTVSGHPQSRASLAFGADGQPIVVYNVSVNLGTAKLNAATFDGINWKLSVLARKSDGTSSISLAVGPDGQPLCTWHERSDNQLYLGWKGSFWSVR